MLANEAIWFRNILRTIPQEQLSPVLNIGSGSEQFRRTKQPHIQRHIIDPLTDSGVRIIHIDIRQEEGIDISGDIYDPDVQEQLRDVGAKTLFCFNILEHLEDRARFADVCESLLPDGGMIAVSVPHSFPYHADPIDTLYRPTPNELSLLFPNLHLIDGEIVECESFGAQLAQSPRKLAGWLMKIFVPYTGLRHWRSAVDRSRWLFRPYRITCAILTRKTDMD